MKPENLINEVNSVNDAISGSNALKLDSTPSSNASNITQIPDNNTTESNIIEFPGNSNSSTFEDNANNVENYSEDEKLKPGDKVDIGKQLDEDGEIEDSSTKKTLKAVGRGAAAYVTGGNSIGKDKALVNFRPVDKAIGVVADTVDKVPGAEEITKTIDETGLADGVNDALDLVGDVKNGDIEGVIDSAEKLNEDGKKTAKFVRKKVVMAITIAVLPLFFIVLIYTILFAPVLGGFIDVVENVSGAIDSALDTAGDFLFGDDEAETAAGIIAEIPGYESLSSSRQKMLAAAASAVAAKIPYKLGSHASGPGIEGIPSSGLDCSAFVEWAIWTGTGTRPGYLTTGEITNRIGKDFIVISEAELKPGDIGLKRRGSSTDDNYNHTGIYAGNGQWFHASGGTTRKVVRNKYKGFKIYLRYTGVD